MCHREGNGTGARLDFRFDVARAAAGVCKSAPLKGVTDAQGIVPGDPARSTIALRMNRRDSLQMPPLATHVVDQDAVGVMDAWARSLTTCE